MSLLMESIHRDDIITLFIICLGISVFSAIACWRAWGIDIHKHLEAEGVAYDELHPEQRAEQERRAGSGPVGPSH